MIALDFLQVSRFLNSSIFSVFGNVTFLFSEAVIAILLHPEINQIAVK
jgi:hypothetical protein